MSVRTRRRRYCITLNNPTAVECVLWNSIVLSGSSVDGFSDLSFFICQTERGDTGTLHYQAYCEFKKALDFTKVKRLFGGRVHLEVSRGSASANIIYCTKSEGRVDDDPVTVSGRWGVPKRGGNLVLLATSIIAGVPTKELVDQHPVAFMLHGAKIRSFVCEQKPKRRTAPKIIILFGLTGCGKSQYCVEKFFEGFWLSPPKEKFNVWWGGYQGEDVVVFDDFNKNWFRLTYMLRLLDSTPLRVAPKGSQVKFTSGTLVFTSNVDPVDWYKDYDGEAAHKSALERRIQDFAEIIDCTVVDGELLDDAGEFIKVRRRVKRTSVFKFSDPLSFANPAVGDVQGANGFGYV